MALGSRPSPNFLLGGPDDEGEDFDGEPEGLPDEGGTGGIDPMAVTIAILGVLAVIEAVIAIVRLASGSDH